MWRRNGEIHQCDFSLLGHTHLVTSKALLLYIISFARLTPVFSSNFCTTLKIFESYNGENGTGGVQYMIDCFEILEAPGSGSITEFYREFPVDCEIPHTSSLG